MDKKIDLLVVFLLLGITVWISIIFNLKPLLVFFLYLLLPSIYLILREKKNFLKIFWAVVIFGAIVGFIFDFIVTFNRGWIVTQLVLPWKIFGVLPLDDVVGWMLMTFFIVVFYEHFLDDEKNKRISKNLKWALIPFITVLIYLLATHLLNPDFLKIPYAYLIGGIIAIIFPLVLSLYRTRFFKKFVKVAGFFFVVWFVLELVCLKNYGWIFPGEYIGQVESFGFRFPFEELFFWMMFYAITVVSYYEFFIDDAK